MNETSKPVLNCITGAGYIRTDDLRKILHNLGEALPHWLVKDLVSNVVDPARRGRSERVYYQNITDVEIKDDAA